MRIANPIYDTVFKYIMNDHKMAMFVLSKFLDRKIIELEYIPKDIQIKKFHEDFDKEEAAFSVYYMDFAATVVDKNGKKEIIIIELQKARTHTDVTRFRYYLGNRYINKNGEYEVTLRNGNVIKSARHIQTIYILGHRLENEEYAKHLALKYTGKLTDALTNENVEISEDPFVDALTHDSLYIQIPNIKKEQEKDKNSKRKKKGLEALINLFDQKDDKRNKHTFDINSDKYSSEFGPLIHLLEKAGMSKDINDEMEKEDIITEEIERIKKEISEMKNVIKKKNKALEKEKEKSEKALEKQKQKSKEESEKALEKQKQKAEKKIQKAQEENQKALEKALNEEKQKAKDTQIELAKSLIGVLDDDVIAEKFGLDLSTIKNLKKEL